MLDIARGWLRTAIALAALAGLRMGEVRALEGRDVDLVGTRLLVRRALSENEVLPPKSEHERVVPLAPELRELIVDSLRDKPPTAGVVLNVAGRTPARTLVLAWLKALQRRHGLPERSFHALRHYSCSTPGASGREPGGSPPFWPATATSTRRSGTCTPRAGTSRRRSRSCLVTSW